MRRWARTDLQGAVLVWLLKLTYAGRDWYWSSSPATPVDADGVSIPHDGGLEEVEVEMALSGIAEEPVQMSVPLSLFWPDGSSLPALIEAGHDFGASRGELALWVSGQPYEDRRVYITGAVSQPEYSRSSDPVAFSITDYPWEGSTVVPAAGAVVTEAAWPSAPSDSIGQVYPEVVGIPGQYEQNPVSYVTKGSPAVRVNVLTGATIELLIAGHHVEATTVKVFDSTTSQDFAVTNKTDGEGRKVATVATGIPGAIDNTETEFWVGWRASDGGARQKLDGDLLQGAGDIIVHYLQESGRRVDIPAWETVAPRLNTVQLGGYWQERLDPWELLVDQVLPLLPVEMVSGANGLRPVLWEYGATSDAAVEHITEGDGAWRNTGVVYSKRDQIINVLTLDYAYRANTNEPRRTITLTGDPDETNPDERYHLTADVSQRRYADTPGERYVSEDVQSSEWVWLDTTANRVLEWQLDARGLMSRSMTLELDPVLGWLDLGDVVTYSEPALAMDRRVAMVRALRWIGTTTLECDLYFSDVPPRDRRI